MKKLLACDVDGTLIRVEEDLGSEACDAVREFRRQGHLFALCTGRTINWVRPIFESSPLEADALILANGASLYTVEGLEPFRSKRLHFHSIPASVGAEIISYLYSEEEVMIYWGDGERTYELIERPMQVAETFSLGSEETVFLNFEDYLKAPMDIVGFGSAPLNRSLKDALRIRDTIVKRWGRTVDAVNNLFFVDVMAKSVSKGDGIRKYLELSGVKCLCYGVGDSFNDEPMFRFVGKERAFLMEDGAEELFPLVRQKVSSVAKCIELILSEK